MEKLLTGFIPLADVGDIGDIGDIGNFVNSASVGSDIGHYRVKAIKLPRPAGSDLLADRWYVSIVHDKKFVTIVFVGDNARCLWSDKPQTELTWLNSEEDTIRLSLFIKYELGYVALPDSEHEITIDEWLYLADAGGVSHDTVLTAFKERERRGTTHIWKPRTDYVNLNSTYFLLGIVSVALYVLERGFM